MTTFYFVLIVNLRFLGCKNFNNESIGSTIPSQSNMHAWGLLWKSGL